MGFFDIGGWEILLILVVALIIWGPGKIPEVARTLGKVLHTLRKASYDFTSTVTKELDMEEKHLPPQPKADADNKANSPPGADKVAPGDVPIPGTKDQPDSNTKK